MRGRRNCRTEIRNGSQSPSATTLAIYSGAAISTVRAEAAPPLGTVPVKGATATGFRGTSTIWAGRGDGLDVCSRRSATQARKGSRIARTERCSAISGGRRM